MTEAEFQFGVRIWGAAVEGWDDLAYFCEERNGRLRKTPTGVPWWDRTARDLDGEMVSYDGGPHERVPDVWALPAWRMWPAWKDQDPDVLYGPSLPESWLEQLTAIAAQLVDGG